jgi:hypothetical protein
MLVRGSKVQSGALPGGQPEHDLKGGIARSPAAAGRVVNPGARVSNEIPRPAPVVRANGSGALAAGDQSLERTSCARASDSGSTRLVSLAKSVTPTVTM